jgi:hypothetical protein
MDAVVAAIPAAGLVTHKYGARYVHQHDSPPVVVWERLAGSFSAPLQVASNPRPLWTKSVEVAIHIWGATEVQTDDIVDNELVGLARVCQSHHLPLRVEPGAANEGWLTRGHAQVLTVRLSFAVIDETKPVAQFDTIAMTGLGGHADGDGWLDSDEA